jgi:hypothetical protein
VYLYLSPFFFLFNEILIYQKKNEIYEIYNLASPHYDLEFYVVHVIS